MYFQEKGGEGEKFFIKNKLMIVLLWEKKKINFIVSNLPANYFIRYQLLLEVILSQTFPNNNCANQHYLEKRAHFPKVFMKYSSI